MSQVENPPTYFPPKDIAPDEDLLRVIYHPDHIDDSGKIKSSAIPGDQLKWCDLFLMPRCEDAKLEKTEKIRLALYANDAGSFKYSFNGSLFFIKRGDNENELKPRDFDAIKELFSDLSKISVKLFCSTKEEKEAERALLEITANRSHTNFKGGFSVDRKQYANKAYIQENIDNSVVRKQGRSLSGFSLIKHETILSIRNEGVPVFFVKADPMKNNPAHALIYLDKDCHLPAQIKEHRKKLMDLLNSRMVKSLDEVLS